MQSLEQQLDSLNALKRQWVDEPVDRAGGAAEKPPSMALPHIPKMLRERRAFGKWLIGKRLLKQQMLQRVGLSVGLALSLGVASAVATVHHRYSDRSLFNIPLQTDAIEGHTWAGEGISFHQLDGDHFDVSFNLSEMDDSEGGDKTQLVLRNIDLTLLIPEVPISAQGNADLTRWFLTEREFNRQRVIFEPGSAHVDLPDGLGDYAAEEVAIALTNNCLGAGYWELAVSVINEDGEQEKIYQGHFTFPRGVYAEIVSWLNPSHYWQQARTMEAWPGFSFLSGIPFALDELRQVDAETVVPITDLKTEEIIAAKEQVTKENLIVYADGTDEDSIRTWEDIRQADMKFQSFVTPGIYDESRLWESDFSQLSTVAGATGRQITSTISKLSDSELSDPERPLVEVEIEFENEAGELRRLIVSGIDWENVPSLESADYSDGVYMPLGYGTPFTQSYQNLENAPPAQSPFFSVLLDGEDKVIDYRKDIGINGLVMHRDVEDENLLHLYLMSYERITLIGHYVIDLDLYWQ